MKGKICSCGHHSLIPILVILFAISFLLEKQGLLVAHSVDIIWPIIVGIGGLVMLVEENCDCC